MGFVNVRHSLIAAKDGVCPELMNKLQRKDLWDRLDPVTKQFLKDCKREFKSEVIRICFQ